MALHVDAADYAARRAALSRAMADRGLDGILLFAQESMYWLTGYDSFGFCFFQCLAVTADGTMALLTRSADLRQARHTSIIADVRVWEDRADAGPVDQLRAVLTDLGLAEARLGVEYDTHGLTARNGRALEDGLAGYAVLEDASDLVPRLRLVKSPSEIAFVRRAAALADDAFEAALAETRPGADEGRILAALQGSILEAGGDFPANPVIIGSGPDALLCRSKAGRRTLDEDDQLTLEFAGVWRHYHAALMRTVVVGRPRERHLTLHAAAVSALHAVEEAMVPGNSFGDVFEAHARVLDGHGLAAHRLAACGYSLGARYAPSWMEWPMFYRGNPAVIAPDMVLFAHMILMDSDTGTAMCVGRTYRTTATAPQPLSRLSLELPIAA